MSSRLRLIHVTTILPILEGVQFQSFHQTQFGHFQRVRHLLHSIRRRQIPTLLFVAQAIDILSNVTEQFVWSRIHLIYRRKRGSTHCITYKTVGTRSFQQSSMETHFHRHSRS